jgi:dihydrofolate reductase
VHTIALVVSSLDGYITKHDASGTHGWASAEDQEHFFSVMSTCDASVMGAQTYLAAREQILKGAAASMRLRTVWTRGPERYLADTIPGKLEFSAEPLAALLTRLHDEGFQRCCVVGGGQVYAAAFAEDLIDELQLTLEPVIFGAGVRHSGEGIRLDARFDLGDVKHLNANTLLLTYQRKVD